MQDQSTAVTMTAACELGSHRCKGVVLSLTGGSWDAQVPCSCSCHSITRDLPDVWAAYPPCDQDVDLSDDDERALEAVAELGIEAALEAAHFGADL
jgi:hypothetical protein